MVDALTLIGDEGRGMAAISFGEVPSNRLTEDLRMRKLSDRESELCIYVESEPREVKHFSTWRKRKQCHASDDISLVAASEKE